MAKILLVDDNLTVLTANKNYFERAGYEVKTATSARELLEYVNLEQFDCVVLDIILPDGHGFELCQNIKKVSDVPILFLSGLMDEKDRVQAFLSGGDDYVTKPYSFQELELRVAARIRSHVGKKTTGQLSSGPLMIDMDNRVVTVNAKNVDFAVMEFNILVFLMKRPNEVFSQAEIYRAIWRQPDLGDPHTVQVHIGRIRKKLIEAFPRHIFIETVWGEGYKFVPYPQAFGMHS